MKYPYNSAQVLTDEIFVDYGGQTGTSTAFQRQVAYFVAESDVSEAVNTPLIPTIITGTYPLFYFDGNLDHAYIQRVIRIRFINEKGDAYYTINGLNNYQAALRNSERGILDIFWVQGNCRCGGVTSLPYLFEIVYECGLTTGTYTSPKVLLALTEASQQELNNMLGYGNESAGLVGITEFSNQDYREKRKAMNNTVFGSTPTAQHIQKLLESLIKLKRVALK